ncbi:MAG TPA: glycosyltransferase family 2 protein [Nitrospirae bacterium]|nr:undecaprenyl-phosphate mannosyltransferase [bacterium BMS3Abin06]HDH12926.1 glycosyltransferase family 2 protein [Nitrospirota bacterium]HDL19851.1 glycosyltransferase family 2 protein [Nitrospirota bacterium]HDZ01662.1 glycosyltransferase family 2 protein [Nitrospirota bacterium]
MTKLIIQIPCYNEEAALGITLSSLPREIPGIDVIEWLVIDDGSTDRTVEVARSHGVDHVIRLPRNQGLARAFMSGLEACLKDGADIIVNTDADNQYCADDIPGLIEPILSGKAEIVVGARPIAGIKHFSPVKKILQKLGSWAVRFASKTDIPDAPSGFRAMTREAAMRLNVFNKYTYTLETIIQAGQKDMAITSVPVRTNEELRPSRLVKSIQSYIRRSVLTIIRITMTYKPFEFFAVPGMIAFALGLLLSLRFLYLYFTGDGTGHVQSVILAALLLGAGFFLSVVGLLADLISVNRKLLEKLDWRIQQMEGSLNEKKER